MMFILMGTSDPNNVNTPEHGFLVGDAYATLEDALKALRKDARTYPCDGYQIWKLILGKKKELVHVLPANPDAY